MNPSKKTLYITLGVVLVVIIAAVVFFRRKESPASDQVQNAPVSQPEKTQPSSQPQAGAATYWQGLLKASDNPKKGNLMLVMDKTTVYINTSRDFSYLVGKQVHVTYQGTTTSFQLGDIVAK